MYSWRITCPAMLCLIAFATHSGLKSAKGGMVVQNVAGFLGGTGSNQMNVTVSNLQPLILRQANGDDAYASGVLNGPAGSATYNVHACSGPAGTEFSAGSAAGGVTIEYVNQYQVTSDTLPNGTPVLVSIIASGARRETTTLNVDIGSANSTNGAAAFGDVSIYFQLPSATYSFPGSFTHSINLILLSEIIDVG